MNIREDENTFMDEFGNKISVKLSCNKSLCASGCFFVGLYSLALKVDVLSLPRLAHWAADVEKGRPLQKKRFDWLRIGVAVELVDNMMWLWFLFVLGLDAAALLCLAGCRSERHLQHRF